MPGVHEVAKSSGVRPEVVAAVFETILASVADGETVRIMGFGSFQRRAFAGRTLQTPAVNGGKPITYPGGYVLKFQQSQQAKRRINVVAKKKGAKSEAPPAANAEAKPKKKKAAETPPAETKPKAKKSEAPPPATEAEAKPKKKAAKKTAAAED